MYDLWWWYNNSCQDKENAKQKMRVLKYRCEVYVLVGARLDISDEPNKERIEVEAWEQLVSPKWQF